jgi:hypothetical protein
MTEQETRIVTLTVDLVDDGKTRTNRDGNSEYYTKAYIPEMGATQWPMGPLWVKGTRPVEKQTLKARLSRSGLKDGKDGSKGPLDYWWNVVEWDVSGATAAPPPDSSQPAGGATNAAIRRAFVDPTNDIDRRRAEDARAFRRRDALNAAVTCAGGETRTPDDVIAAADVFFAWLNQHPEPDTQDLPPAPEQPAQQHNEPEGTKPPGRIIIVPNQITVPDMMDSSEFVAAATKVEWSREQVRAFLGDKSATQFTEEDNSDQDYRPAWDACVNAWQNAQEPVEELSW